MSMKRRQQSRWEGKNGEMRYGGKSYGEALMLRSIKFFALSIVSLIIVGNSLSYSQDDYEKWKKGETDKYQQWKDARDKEFTEFLKADWKAFQSFKEQTLFDVPKPKILPVAPPRSTVKSSVPQKPQPPKNPEVKTEPKIEPKAQTKPQAEIQPLPKPRTEPQPESKVEPKPEEKSVVPVPPSPPPSNAVDPAKNSSSLSLDFYEASVPILYDNGLTTHLEGVPSPKSISAFWEAMSKSNYEDFVKQAQLNKERMKLNDWGYCEFLNKTAEKLFPGSRNESNMFDWFMLSKSGYLAKIGYSGDNVYLLLPTTGVLYGVTYYMFGNSTTKFYNVMFDRYEKAEISKMFSYDQNYPDAVKLTGCRVDAAPYIHSDVQTKTLKFTHNGSQYSVKVEFDRSAVKFFEYYPQTDLEVYFDAVPSTDARTSLLDAIRPLLKDRSETEAVDLLLHFVQTAFKYETDDEQFGREKPFFPEETLYYPGSDCEDRAVLFSFLVRNLLGLEVVGLDYPNHVATAVRFKGDVNGDQVVYQNRKFIICDPTYINADYGMCMPQFKNVKPGVIALK